jgi:hypothetical protein
MKGQRWKAVQNDDWIGMCISIQVLTYPYVIVQCVDKD